MYTVSQLPGSAGCPSQMMTEGTPWDTGCLLDVAFCFMCWAEDSNIYERSSLLPLQVPEEAHCSPHIMHSCRKVWASLPQSQIVGVRCTFLLPWEVSLPCQDSSMLKALIWPSTTWIEMKQLKYKKEDFITLSFRLCNPFSPSCVTPAFWAELY